MGNFDLHRNVIISSMKCESSFGKFPEILKELGFLGVFFFLEFYLATILFGIPFNMSSHLQ